MKRILILCVLLLTAFGLSAQVKFSGLTDAYAVGGEAGFQSNVGQDLNISAGPVSLVLTGDWERATIGADTLALTYVLGFNKAFGVFTPGLKLSGDQTYGLDALTAQSGDWFSDLEPSLDIVLGKFGANLYSDLSFEKGYNVLQTVDASAFYKIKTLELRAGLLYMDSVAVVDDIGYPNSPVAREGVSFYAKASVSY